ncbi:MAG: alpha-galactosidase [Verrucomicrobia bacterium]|nr:alpha-galactosidase [Verrucomicrobiota bacterium]
MPPSDGRNSIRRSVHDVANRLGLGRVLVIKDPPRGGSHDLQTTLMAANLRPTTTHATEASSNCIPTMKPRSSLAFVVAGLFLLATSPLAVRAAVPSREELALSKKWTAAHFDTRRTQLPFSFNYGGKSSAELLSQWKLSITNRKVGDAKRERTLTWQDPATRLLVRCVVIEYSNYPAVEWTLYFKNEGGASTPILKDVEALDAQFERKTGGEFVLHTTIGDWSTAASFQPITQTLEPGQTKSFAPYGGRPNNAAFPFYNLQQPGGGILLAVGWPGQWASSFTRDADRSLRIKAGQQELSASLQPGEEIRSPLIAMVFWRGNDLVAAQNLWRSWMVAHNLPRTGDRQLPPTQIVACSSHQYKEMTLANEENQKMFVDRYVQEGMKLDYWWMDAGWYPCNGEWVNTGTWEPDPERFPRGLRAVSDHARAKGIKTIVWFEPERVGDTNSWIAKNHPEWLLSKKAKITAAPKGGSFGSGPGRLFNLGNREALGWLINHVDRLIREQGIDLYRQDFNIDPLTFWKGADSPDRQGMTENLYVQGYLAYWDALRQRHPQLRIDSCASGGRRDDLETLRRAVPLIRSDHLFEPTSQQNHHFQYASWIPYHGAGYVVGHSDSKWARALIPTVFEPTCLPASRCAMTCVIRN